MLTAFITIIRLPSTVNRNRNGQNPDLAVAEIEAAGFVGTISRIENLCASGDTAVSAILTGFRIFQWTVAPKIPIPTK